MNGKSTFVVILFGILSIACSLNESLDDYLPWTLPIIEGKSKWRAYDMDDYTYVFLFVRFQCSLNNIETFAVNHGFTSTDRWKHPIGNPPKDVDFWIPNDVDLKNGYFFAITNPSKLNNESMKYEVISLTWIEGYSYLHLVCNKVTK